MDHFTSELPKRYHLSRFGVRRFSPPIAGRMDHSAADLPKPHPSDVFAPRSASMLHCRSPRGAGTSPKIAR